MTEAQSAQPVSTNAPYTMENVFGDKEKKISRHAEFPQATFDVLADVAKRLTKEERTKMKENFVAALNRAVAMPKEQRWRMAQLFATSSALQIKNVTRPKEVKTLFLPMSVQVPHPGEEKRKTSNPGIVVYGLAKSLDPEHPYERFSNGWIGGLPNIDAADKFAGQIQEGKIYTISAALPTDGSSRLFIDQGGFDLKSVQNDGVPDWANPMEKVMAEVKPSTGADLIGLTDPDKKQVYLLRDMMIVDSQTGVKNGQQFASIIVIDGSIDYATAERLRGGLRIRLARGSMDLAYRKGSMVTLLVNGNKYDRTVRDTSGNSHKEPSVGWGVLASQVTMNFSTDQAVPEPGRVIGTMPTAPTGPSASAGGEPEVSDI